MLNQCFSVVGWARSLKEQPRNKLCTLRNSTKALSIQTQEISKMCSAEWVSRCLEVWRLPVRCFNFTSKSKWLIISNIRLCRHSFHRTTPAVVFWQFVNQSFNALVNYTNRNANSPVTTTQLGIAYVSATTSALVASLGYKAYLQKRNNPFLQRYAPFAAVAVANCKSLYKFSDTVSDFHFPQA